MMKVKKIAAVAAATGGLVLAAAGVASAHGGAAADGVAAGSPGVVSGNQVQVPVHIPVNVCGNTVSVIGVLNPAFGNHCANF
ncbi:chaplin [Kitasatospora sp. NPDC001539]|uniref:chaplin n=2 Tax=unclassified Kitasatospora TaxID=2633591 RepID=UPI0033261D00